MNPDSQRRLVAATKPGLEILPTEEMNAETPAHLLDDDITPLSHLFVRNTGTMTELDTQQAADWTLTVDGCVRRPRQWTVTQLRAQFETVTQIAVLECAGNGRAFFPEPFTTVRWRVGAVGCVAWTGVRLADLLAACGVTSQAVYTGHHSPDRALDGGGAAMSRGVPIAKALAAETLVAWAGNGEPLPLIHGGPLRLVAPGFPGAAWQKWISRIAVREREHDGVRMGDLHYRMPRVPLRPDDPIDPATFDVITDMPMRSLVTSPAAGFAVPAGTVLEVRGFAWSGHTPLARVDVSGDGGQSWQPAELGPLPDRFAWRRFFTRLAPPAGEIEIVARATDAAGRTQPLQSAPWNPRGYLNNTVHRVRGRVG